MKKNGRLVPCMPPLIEEETRPLSRAGGDTRFGGSACELAVKNYFLSQSNNVAEPHVDVGVDLLIEKPEGWVRGQVKKVVYCKKLDSGMLKNSGKRIYREDFKFQFQGGGGNVSWLKNGRRQRTINEIDLFYHVLFTCYRTLIWEIPASIVPLREDNKTFVHCVSSGLVRDNWKRKPAAIDLNKHLIYTRYDPIIFKTYPDFFLKPEQTTLDNFFVDEQE